MIIWISFRQIASRTDRAGPRSCLGTSRTEGATYGFPSSLVIRLASSADRLASVTAMIFPCKDAIMIAARAPGLRHARALAEREREMQSRVRTNHATSSCRALTRAGVYSEATVGPPILVLLGSLGDRW